MMRAVIVGGILTVAVVGPALAQSDVDPLGTSGPWTAAAIVAVAIKVAGAIGVGALAIAKSGALAALVHAVFG